MYKDPTEFRARFKAYKEGKKPYENGLPAYAPGKQALIPAYELFINTLGPLLYKELLYQKVADPDSAYRNMITQLAYESNYGRSRVAREQHNYGGVGWNGSTYTTYNNEADFLHDYVRLMNSRYKSAINNPTLYGYAKDIKKLGYYEDTLENYSKNLMGMKSLHSFAVKHKQANPDLYVIDQPPLQVLQDPIVVKNDATTVKTVIPEEHARHTYDNAEASPYVTGKPILKLQPRVQLPDLLQMVESNKWVPEYQPLKFKNGKLPGYKRGKVDLGVNPTNATINDDGTFTDDYTKVFDDLVITPKGTRVKNLYRYQEPWDDEKFLNAVTVGGLNNLSPALWIRRGYDLATGNLTADSWLNGNAGVVPNSYAKEHPLMSMAANGLVDFWILGGSSLLKNARDVAAKDIMRSLNNNKYYTSQPYYPEYKYSKEYSDYLNWKREFELWKANHALNKTTVVKPILLTPEANINAKQETQDALNRKKVIVPKTSYNLNKVSNDIAKDPYIDDATDAWISIMNRNNRDWDYRHAQTVIDENLPELYEVEDIWAKNGRVGQKPKFYEYNKWKEIPEEQRLLILFDEKVDPLYGITYFMLKPEYRGLAKLSGDVGYPYGISPRINIDDPDNGMFTAISKEIRNKGPFVSDEIQLKLILGEERVPYLDKINKPIHPKDRLDWSDYRKQALEKINLDWNSNGPLSQHLKRSGISDPSILMDYILSPELAWNTSMKSPGLDIGLHIFNMSLQDDVFRNTKYLNAFEVSLNKVLKRYGYDDLKLDKSKIISAGGIKSLIQKHVIGNSNITIPKSLERKLNKIYDAAINDVLKRDETAAKEFYNQIEKSYNNAFANHKGGMYIPLKTNNYTNVVSHEFGHLEDNPFTYSKEIIGVPESNLVTQVASGKSALFKKAFNVENSDSKRYFVGRDEKNATEMVLRATQIKDFLKVGKNEEVTPEMLLYAIDNYVKKTGMDNNMTEFFNTIVDLKAAAKWITIHGKAVIPTSVGLATYKKLNPKNKTNK